MNQLPMILTTSPWGSSPVGIVVKVYDITDGSETDVTTTIIPDGEASAVGDVITLPPLTAMTPGKRVPAGSQVYSGWQHIGGLLHHRG